MQISEEQKSEIKARIDLADLISSYGNELRHNGSGIWCRCPFHNEKTPSFKIDAVAGYYHCFGCGESGDAISFVMKQDGLTFGEAVRKLAEKAGVEIKAVVDAGLVKRQKLISMMSELALDFNKLLKAKTYEEAQKAREYLESRQLDKAVVDKFLVGYVPQSVDKLLMWAKKRGYTEEDLATAGVLKLREGFDAEPYSYFGGRLVFSIRDKYGKVIGFSGRKLDENQHGGKYVNSPETILFKKARTIFAFDEARKNIVKHPAREAIICEGQIDCIRLHANGFPTAVAPLGTAFTEEHAIMLHRVADCAMLCFDDDAAGHKATLKTAALLLAEGMPVRVLSLPDGDDPDSYIVKHGAEGFSRLVYEAPESIVSFQTRIAKEQESNLEDPNAIVRITKAVLATISYCKSKLMQEALIKEASKLLGLNAETLMMEIKKSVPSDTEKVVENPEKPLYVVPEKANKSDNRGLPDIEGAFLLYLLEKDCIAAKEKQMLLKLFPDELFQADIMKRMFHALLDEQPENTDMVRQTVETMSTEEYRDFTGIMTFIDGMTFFSMEERFKTVYFAREIWHRYFIRKVELVNAVSKTQTSVKLLGKILKCIKIIHSGTFKEVVKLMTCFNLKSLEESIKALYIAQTGEPTTKSRTSEAIV